MNEDDFYSAGMNEFQKIIQEYQEKFEQRRIEAAMMDGAEQLARDVRALPKPRSQIRKSGYAHLLDTVSARKGKNGEVEVGWGKYYGPMVEAGTLKMNAQPHLRGLFKKDSNKYYNLILQRLFR